MSDDRDEIEALRQELDDHKADLARLVDQLAEANGRNVDLQELLNAKREYQRRLADEVDTYRDLHAKVERERDEAHAELANREKRREKTRRMLEATRSQELDELRTAARHVVDCYRHGNLMGVIVGADKLAGLVDP